MAAEYRVLLYYYFVRIDDHDSFAREHLELCRTLNLLGRIIVAPEGINGTVSGKAADCEAYMRALHEDPRFAAMPFKIDEADDHVFQKIFVRARPEIIALGEQVSMEKRGGYLSPAEFLHAIQDEDVILLDGRNNYETDIGRFKGAICPNLDNFRDFPAWILENLGPHRKKRIVTYCTGGIRCEKLTAWMVKEGFEDVWQLDGGIVTYGYDPAVRGEAFEGQCYVFDDRVGVPINRANDAAIITKCLHCGCLCEVYINCPNVECNALHASCPSCQEKMAGCCSEECRQAPCLRYGPGRLANKAELPARKPAPRNYQLQ
ncbi:MAG: rhodanese-related sulfurtransferase [Chthonomonas sp.]|nr:rhodanese-related sulfurtransferase [Chthonomonas sp.]